ncbi:hypothetical protein [Streptomyces sp. NBC_01775]|uniref:hypothetical protein n=1 Tax=Streptomyces sp. NBC_01775 TaxID=2975939 RepID=UPI003FA3DBD9
MTRRLGGTAGSDTSARVKEAATRKISDRSVLVTGGSRGLGLMERGGVDRLAALTAAIDVVRRGGRVSISGVYGGALDPLGVGHFTTHTLSLEEGPNAYGTSSARRRTGWSRPC